MSKKWFSMVLWSCAKKNPRSLQNITELMIYGWIGVQRTKEQRFNAFILRNSKLQIKKNLFFLLLNDMAFVCMCVIFNQIYNRNTKNRIKWATISNIYTMKMMQNIILFRYNCLLNWFQLNGYEENMSVERVCVCACACRHCILNAINACCCVHTMADKINVYVSVCWHVICFVLGEKNHSNKCVYSILLYVRIYIMML